MTVADRHFESVGNGSSAWMTESVGGIVAIVLTILGLAHVAPVFLVAIALIAASAALVIRGAGIVREYSRLLQRETSTVVEVGGGSALYVELLAGGAGIVLGILALLNVDPTDLVAIGVIALGGALVLSTSASVRLVGTRIAATRDEERMQNVIMEITASSAGVQALAGLTAIVLGILALAGFSPVILVLVALLTLGSFILLNGVSISGAVMTAFR